MDISSLTNLGLSEKEAQVYILLLKEGALFMHEIANKCPFKRGDLYNILQSLEEWGLTERQEEGKRYTYQASHPSRLEEMLREQEQSIKHNKEKLKTSVRLMAGLYNKQHNKAGVQFYEGKEEIQELLYDSLKPGSEIYTIIDLDAVYTYGKDINDAYLRSRKQQQVQKKILVVDTVFAREHFNTIEKSYTDVRFLPKKYFSTTGVNVQLYGNTVAFFSATAQELSAVSIHNPAISTLLREQFQYLWDMAAN